MMKALGRLRPQECAKRWKEFGAKAQALVTEAFGEKVKDMYEIQALCTCPDAQGRGYASALVEYVLKQGDADGHDVWLLATDAYGFYEHFGFAVVRSGMIAVDNPAWDGEPITLYIMHRPAVTPELK
uniref:Non-canonical non-ribosomal peptide synthetase FUB8 ) n=1 Tax=Ganoderma boninense TaxID=34458 RepID=A0A5K1K435_9APHY|nr:Non-canonical non-ribosomal peptide synthetase FUB8 (EC (Fusaric acid biosynthesis protein 8) [Ganoderma boninense]